MTDTGIITIHGKEYQTVALRIQTFRTAHPDYSLTTEIIEATDSTVTMCATIANANGGILANGHAEEKRGSSQINKTSALENCETSAIGRALANLGFGGTEFASANEVENAIHQQNTWPSGPLKNKSAAKKLWREEAPGKIAATRNADELDALVKGWSKEIAQTLAYPPMAFWIEGGGDETGEDWQGIKAMVQEHRAELKADPVGELIGELDKLDTAKAVGTWESTNLARLDALDSEGADIIAAHIETTKERIAQVGRVNAG